jgi:Tol biopolymer transport system component
LAVAALIGAIATAGVAVLAGDYLRPTPAPEPKPVVRFSVPLRAELAFPANLFSMIAVSPDGQKIAYFASGQIFLRSIGERESHPVQGTAESGFGPVTPVFSPDGQWLAYVQVAGAVGPFIVKRVPISGGAPATLHEAEGVADFPYGLSWPTTDTIVFANPEGIVRIPANGGATDVLVARRPDERLYSPQLLPGGDAVLFTSAPGNPGEYFGGFEAAQVVVQSIGGDDRKVVLEGGSAARYLPTGQLVYAQGTTLFAIPFDPEARAVRGGAVRMVEALRRSTANDAAYFDVSATGTLVTVSGGSDAEARYDLTWVDRNGREEPFPAQADDYAMARISPDGTQIALVIGAMGGVRNTPPAIWHFDQRTENLSALTADPAGDDSPVWSADGSRIFFRSNRGGTYGMYAIELDAREAKLVAGSSPEFPFAQPWTISPDGRTLGLIYAPSDINLGTFALADDGEPARLLHDPEVNENEPTFSPNGEWIAYAERRRTDGTAEIIIRPFPGVSRTFYRVGPGSAPVFSRDGSELFFFDGQGLAAAPITYEPTLRVGAPRRLFESTAYLWGPAGRAWDADPSGERFLMIRVPVGGDDGEQPTARIDVVLNWFEELESRVPVDSD